MTPLELAAKVLNFDIKRAGMTEILRFSGLAQLAGGETGQYDTIQIKKDLVWFAISGAPSDGAPASYAGLEVEFQYGDRNLASDGQAAQFVPCSMLAGRGPGPSQVGGPWFELLKPVLLARGTVLSVRCKNTTAATDITPSVACKVVELR